MRYDESGVQLAACEYEHGVLHGRCTIRNSEGELVERGEYDKGTRAGSWWFWSLPTGAIRISKVVSSDVETAPAVRSSLVAFFRGLGVATEAAAFAQLLIEYETGVVPKRVQLCGKEACVGPGHLREEPVFVNLRPSPEQTARDATQMAALAGRAEAAAQRELALAEDARRAREAEEERAARARLATVKKAAPKVRKILIRESIDSYPGSCPCPYNRASNGSACGRRSAYSREGGYGPLCYARDVTLEMVEAYIDENGVPP